MKTNSIIAKYFEPQGKKHIISKKNFISLAEIACIQSISQDKNIWATYQNFWKNLDDDKRNIVLNQIVNEMEDLTNAIEKSEKKCRENIFAFQVKASLFKKLNVKQPKFKELSIEYDQLLERAYRAPKSAKFQNYADDLMLKLPLPKKEWVDAIIYAVSQPLISQNSNLIKLTLKNQYTKIQLAAAAQEEWLNPPAILVEKSVFNQKYTTPFSFEISTYLTQDWVQVIKIISNEPISLISWQGTRVFFDKKLKNYLLEVKLKPDPFQYLNKMMNSLIRIISIEGLTIEIQIK